MDYKRLDKRFNRVLVLVLTIAALAVGQSVWAQATQEVGVMFGWEQKSSYYRYSIHPWNLSGSDFISDFQASDHVSFNKVFDIGDHNIPLTMNIKGDVNFTNANNFTVDYYNFEITFTSTTKYIMGARVTTTSQATVSGCTITGAGTKEVTVKIPDNTFFGAVILTIANHTPFGKDNSATISGIEDTYLDNGVNEPEPTVTYKEFSNSSPVTLTAGTDYTVSYSNNHYLGTATLTVTGTGNYIGSVSKDYNIRSYDLSDFNSLGNNTYEIATRDDLDHLAIYVNRDNTCQGVTFKQTTDIAYDYTTEWNNQESDECNFTAVGGYGKPFSGTYDGQGYTIKGLRIYKNGNNFADESQGLFGYVGTGGTVKNVVLANSRIIGYTNTGGIVGYNSGTIEDCIVGNDVRVYFAVPTENHGGIAGINSGGIIRRCTSSVSLNNYYYSGGIVGRLSSGSVTDCLAIDAKMFSSQSYYGAIVGGKTGGTIARNYYYNSSVNGYYANVGTSDGDVDGARSLRALTLASGVNATITGGETVVIKGQTYYVAGTTFTLSGASSIDVPEGYSAYEGYTIKYGKDSEINLGQTGGTFTMPDDNATVVHRFTAIPWTGSGTENAPYIIRYASQLDLLAKQVNGTHGYTANYFSGQYFQLANDITYPHVTDWNDATSTENNYTAIGKTFCGVFDGCNHTISGIRIYSYDYDNQGLFGEVAAGIVKNVILNDARITGLACVGGIVGSCTKSTVQNCHVTNSVTIHAAMDYAGNHGGIVGYAQFSNRIVNCTSAAQLTVAEGKNVSCYGGIVGNCNPSDVVENCISIGVTVPAVSNRGAIMGVKNGTLSNNYYYGCNVGGVTMNVGTNKGDVSDNDGAVQVDAVLSDTETVPTELSGKVVFRREFTGGKASTICLPFAMTKIEGGKVYQFVDVTYNQTEGWVATMSDATPGGNNVTSTEANKPYLFLPEGSGSVPVLFYGTVSASISAGTTTSGDWTFHGTYTYLSYGSAPFNGTVFGFAATDGKATDNSDVTAGQFVKAADGASIKPFRSYLTYSGSNQALQAPGRDGSSTSDIPDRINVRLIGSDGNITAVGTIDPVTGDVTIERWFDINGRAVEGTPSRPGLYLNNGGKKIMIK